MKILIIRFSSIGDIILTTPVVRCIKKQLGAEVHYLVKKSFANVLQNNPYIDKFHFFETWDDTLIKTLKAEKFDKIIDLHKNIRSKRVIVALDVPALSFDKLNVQKWFMTALKINFLPKLHLVDRYFRALEKLGIQNDDKGLDYFVDPENEFRVKSYIREAGLISQSGYIAMAIGSAQRTKVPPLEIYTKIINQLQIPVVLLGGPGDAFFGNQIVGELPQKTIINVAGNFKLGESVAFIKNAQCLITPDTGLMHAGAAVGTPIIVLWGNTIPEFGMHPYFAGNNTEMYFNQEVKDLACRPCSKIGYKHCPKKHFNCMVKQDVVSIIRNTEILISQRQKNLN